MILVKSFPTKNLCYPGKNVKRVTKTTIKASKKAIEIAKKTAKSIKVAIKATITGIKALVAGTKALIAFLLAGGWIAVIVVLVIVLIGGLIAAFYKSNNDIDLLEIENNEILLVAQAQLGNDGGEKFWKWYGYSERVEWCACFVSYCANECGYIEKGIIPKFSNCDNGIQWFKDNDKWGDRESNYYPFAGDIIFFDWDNEEKKQDGISDHVGIVLKIDLENNLVYTIEGNSNDKCKENKYSLDDIQIMGYGIVNELK